VRLLASGDPFSNFSCRYAVGDLLGGRRCNTGNGKGLVTILLALDEHFDRAVDAQPLGQAVPAPSLARMEYGADQNLVADGLN
jgi:hypothetical protein